MQTPKSRNCSSEAPQKVSPRTAWQLKPTALQCDSASSSSNQAIRTPKERSPKVIERKSPLGPLSSEKKRPSKISELELQISQLKEDLKKAKEELSSSASWKKRAEQESEKSKDQLSDMSLKLEESRKKLLALSASEEIRIAEIQKISLEKEQSWKSELESIQKQHSVESSALEFAMSEIQRLKLQLETVNQNYGVVQATYDEPENEELRNLKLNLTETLSVVENMKTQLKNCKESEAQAQELVDGTLLQLETAKKTMEALKLDGIISKEAQKSMSLELDESKARVKSLEGVVSKLEADLVKARNNSFHNSLQNQTEEELYSLRLEVERLKSSLEKAETKYNEEQNQSEEKTRTAYEQVELLKSGIMPREAELEKELKDANSIIEELKANLMDKETELQGISEENEGLNSKLEKIVSSEWEIELENQVKELKEHLVNLKADLMDKETEFQIVSEENGMLKSEIDKWKVDMNGNVNDAIIEEEENAVKAARKAQREATAKLRLAMEEADKTNVRAAEVAEQLAVAQAANADMATELKRLKVQSEQWRKAAEAAASMLSVGNNGRLMERSGSLDSNYSPGIGKISSPYLEDGEDDLMKKKNGNVLKKIGVLWKKQQK